MLPAISRISAKRPLHRSVSRPASSSPGLILRIDRPYARSRPRRQVLRVPPLFTPFLFFAPIVVLKKSMTRPRAHGRCILKIKLSLYYITPQLDWAKQTCLRCKYRYYFPGIFIIAPESLVSLSQCLFFFCFLLPFLYFLFFYFYMYKI